MSFLDDLGKTLTGTISNLTGQTTAELNAKALDIQAQIARDTLAKDLEAQRLKYSPELSKQRTKQIALVVISISIVVGLIIYFKFIR